MQTLSDPSTFLYVLGKVKGCGMSLGEVATRARKFEAEMNAWYDMTKEQEEEIR